jgi:LPXTG-site transpeptidase (sortase) family protein
LLLNTYNNQELSVKINSLADQLIIHQQQFSPEQFAPVKGFYSGQFHTKKAGYFDFVATPLEESYWLHYDCPISNNRPGGGSNSGGSSFQDQTDQKQRDPEHPAANEEDPDLSPEPEINKPEPETTPDKKLAILPQRIPLDQYQKEYPLVTQSRAKDDLAKTIEIPRTGQVSQKLLEEYQTKSYFPDSSVNHPFYEAAVNLALQGVVQGDGSGRINLDQPILRSEMAKIILKALEVDVPQNFAAIFPDTYADEWYQPFVNYSYHAGIFKGYQNGHFGPGDPVNYGQILAIISRSFPTHFSVSEDTYANYYKVMLRKNLLPQSLKSSQDFLRPLTRGEVFEILYRTLVVVDNQENHYYDQLEISFPGLNLENIPTNRTLISNSSVWLADLINGAGFYSSTQNDNLVVFAHSSDYNWNHNENGTIFKPLISGLNVGDEVIITKNNTQVKYQITAKRLVEGSDAQALKEAAMNNSLTIFTCDYDLSKRYLFTARIL